MRKWWCEKDYSNLLNEKDILKDETMDEIVDRIMSTASTRSY